MADDGPSPSMGRTKSFHSTRLREKSEQKQVKKRQLEEVQHEEYEEGQFVAVRWADPPHYWLARVAKDRGSKLAIMWLDPKGKFYVEDAPDTINKLTVLQRVTMSEKDDGKYALSISEKKKIQELVKLDEEDGEFVNSDTEDEPEKRVAKVAEEDEEDIPIKEEPDEEFEPEEKETKRKAKGKGKKANSDEESAEETPKKRGRGRPKRKKDDAGEEETPRKRKAKRKAPGSDEEEEEAETPKKKRTPRKKKVQEDDDEGGGEGPSTPAAKRRKKASPKSPASTRKKKHIADINPDIPVIEVDPRFYDTDDHLHTNCCTYCTNKEAIRAVLTNNKTLLKAVMDDRTHVYSVSTRRSADVEMNALLYAVRTSNFDAFKAIWEGKHTPTESKEKEVTTACRPNISLNQQGTGHYTRATYGHAVRAINMSRGGKEGNNAFTADEAYYDEEELEDMGYSESWVPILLREVMRNKNMTQEFILWLITNLDNDDFSEHLSDHVFLAVQEGNRELAIFLVDYLIKRDGWGFNNVHLQALSLNGPDFDKFRSTSVIKKPVGNNAITPVHMAAINPNPKYLKALLAVQPAFDIEDGTERRPVHYAAACSSTAPLQFLMSKGMDFMSPDMCGTTPLMIAARLGLLENINLLLRGYMSRNKLKEIYQNTDFHTKIAEQITKYMGGEAGGKKKAKEPETSKASDKGAQVEEAEGDKEDEGMEDAGQKKSEPVLPLKEMSRESLDTIIHPLEEMVDFANIFANEVPEAEEEEPPEDGEGGVKLAEAKKVPYVDAVDDNGYSALFYAVESDQPKAVELLIYKNASVELIDGSGKKITPLILACQLGHLECVKILVEKGKAGVDTADKLKRTPLIHAAKNGHLPVLSYLLHRGANGNAADTSGNTVTHYAAAFGWAECVKFLIEKGKVEFNAVNAWKLTPFQIALAKSHLACLDILLQQHGIDLNVRGENGCTALAQTCQTFKSGTLPIVKFIIEKGADVTIPDADGITPLHFIAMHIEPTDTSASEAAELLLAHKADINAQSVDGSTPFDMATAGNNWYACKFLLSKGANVPPKEGANILHEMMGHLVTLDANLMDLLATLSTHPNFEFLAKQTNDEGFTPFLSCISAYSNNDFMEPNPETGVMERNAAKVAQFSTAIDIFLNKLKLDASQSVQQLKKPTADSSKAKKKPKKGGRRSDDENEDSDESDDESGENDEGDESSNKNESTDNDNNHAHPEFSKYSAQGRKTALHFLATQKDTSLEIFKTILAHKPNLNALDIDGKTPLLLAINHRTTSDAEPSATIIELLLDAGTYVVDKPDPKPYGLDPLFYAQKIHSPLVASLYNNTYHSNGTFDETLPLRLLELGANPKGCEDWKTLQVPQCFIPPPLLVAIAKNMEKTVQLLIKKGANVNAASREGVPENLLKAELPSPLFAAVGTNYTFVKMLIDAGADVNYLSRSPSTDVDAFLSEEYFKIVMTPEAKPVDAPDDWQPTPPPPLCHPLVTAVSNGDHESSIALIEAKSDLYADKGRGPSPIHLAAHHPIILRHILSLKGVDFMAPDHNGDLLLHHVVNYTPEGDRQAVIEDLVKLKKVDINTPGKDKCTALHYAINNSQAAEDANFDFETFLITMGANINLRDAFGRTPLHYAFVKIGIDQFDNKEHADPIEVVTSLCAYKELELDVPDRYGRTPLHYAAQHGALISTLFLLQKGVALDREDIGGNTPLGIALRNEHPQYALILIREKADVKHPLYLGSFAEVKDTHGNVTSHDGDFKVESKVTMFSEIMKHDWQGIVYLMLYSGFDYLEAMQDAIHAGRFKLAITLLNKTKDDKIVTAQHPTTKQTLMHYLANCTANRDDADTAITLARTLQARGVALDSLDSSENMPFHYAAKNGFYDLALLLLGMTREDVLYQPLVTLSPPKALKVAKSPNVPNKEGKTPLAEFMNSTMTAESPLLLQLLLRTGADPDAMVSTWVWNKDKVKKEKPEKNSPIVKKTAPQRKGKAGAAKPQRIEARKKPVRIKNQPTEIPADATKLDVPCVHYAFKKKWYDLVKNLMAFGANPNARHALTGNTILMALVKRGDIGMIKDIAGTFATKFDPNITDNMGLTPISHAVKTGNLDIILLLLSLSSSFKTPIDLGVCDNEGKTPIIHAICENNINILQLLLNGKTIVDTNEPNKYVLAEPLNVKVNINTPGRNGWTAVHYVVNPLEDEFGSYENIEILELLVAKGADLNAKDNLKRTPLHYASVQDSGKLARALQKLGAAELPKGLNTRLQSSIFEWPDNGLNFNLDAQKVLDSIDESEAEAQAVDPIVPVDKYAKDAGVVNWDEVKTKEGKKKVYYDVLMTIVDIAHGSYGINNFYKMQVLWDEVRDLHILWTRWGRIGTTGQFQRTPFPSAEEAKKEFRKLFKAKSGNNWEDKDNFERKPKKYKLITNEHVPHKARYMKDILEPLSKYLQDPKKAKEAHMHTEITLAMQQFTNTSILNKAMVQAGLNMQLYKLTDGTLEEARKVLLTLKEAIQKLDASRTEQPPPGVDDLLKAYETINTLSNQYYELIPHTDYSQSAIPPLDALNKVNKKLEALQSLVDVEVACKILMGAQCRMKDMHPLLYCFNSLEIKAEPLHKSGKEFQYLFKYFANTFNNQVRAVTRPLSELENPSLQKEPYSVEVVSIIRIQRKGEAERIGKWKSLDNHKLLWHGSSSSNFLGILSQGLRIAPPEAPVSGYAFGKGVYFADCAAKSYGYCRGTKDAFLLLSEVALGKIFTISDDENAPHVGYDTVEPPLGFNSVHSLGGEGPDWNKSIVMPNGVSIPVETTQSLSTWHRYGYSEYIVYDVSQVRMRYLVHVRSR